MVRFAVLTLPLLLVASFAGAAEPAPNGDEFFEKEVRPLLIARCLQCHGDNKTKGDLKLTSRETLLKGGDRGPAVAPGKPDESLIVQAVRFKEKPKMPPTGKLDDREIQTLTRWVAMGAPWPKTTVLAAPVGEFRITDQQRKFWSFQPVKATEPPSAKDAAWNGSPIDRFLQVKRETLSLKPVGLADKRVLIRRVTFDLTGLPPTPEEIDAFLADDSSKAFEKVVDRLLASPAYGERWGRYWLDVAHYADTAGETADYPVPQAYRYRNYVIDSFNADKPYDQFVREQIAGDLLTPGANAPGSPGERLIATGFLAGARRFGFDPQNYHYLTIEDTIDTTGKAILGLTVACARCHDHKFDPISQGDYYAFYGIFDSTKYPFPGSEEHKAPSDFPKLPDGQAVYAVGEGTPHNVHIHKRGDPLTPGAEAPRRFLQILGGQPVPADGKSSGRLQLADWLSSPKNPLTARVMVNRIWQHHFGEGLVRTPNNFGKQGRSPTHPELLDYLADRFMASGWSVKAMHKMILLSRTYQLSSAEDAGDRALDPNDENLWRFDRRRLDAEAIRDSLLAVSGTLDRTMPGPHPFPPANTWNFTQHNPFQAVYATNHRSVYLMTQRQCRQPYLALFDGADPNTSTAARSTTTVPTQALFFLNDPFVHDLADKFAARILTATADKGARIDLAHRIAYGRPATPDETHTAEAYLRKYEQGLKEAGVPAEKQTAAAWASYARVLFAANEFVYID
jgi:cytochrome c553